jgi:uncharacterized protein (TIGR00255 family)
MIRSMTGFGDASAQVEGIHYLVELRSLNNKYFKATLRLPEAIVALEAEVEQHLRKRATRGSFVVSIKTKLSDALATHRINDTALLQYLEHLETIHKRLAHDDHERAINIDLTALLAMPGVLQPSASDEALLHKSRPVVFKLLDEACDKLNQMRTTEGQAIGEELLTHRDLILDRMKVIETRAPFVVNEYHQRLRSRVDELLARAELKTNETDLIREVAVFAERADIREELTRLNGHLEQFAKIILSDNSAPAGRTLDFLSQELLREANTVASKSNDATISRAIVEVKSAIDRIKEQVQNVE